MANTSNPAGLSHEQILALRDASGAPGAVPQTHSASQWSKAPDISKPPEKVTRPAVSDGAGHQVTTDQVVKGPSVDFMKKQASLRAEQLAKRDELVAAKKDEQRQLEPQALLSRIAFLERSIKKLEKTVTSLKKQPT